MSFEARLGGAAGRAADATPRGRYGVLTIVIAVIASIFGLWELPDLSAI